jgi:hypothetical protein
MTQKIKFNGRISDTSSKQDPAKLFGGEQVTEASIDGEPDRDVRLEEVEAEPRDVVELRYEDGTSEVITLDELERRYGGDRAVGGDIILSARTGLDDDRGVTEWVLRGLKLFRIADHVAEEVMTAAEVARRVEEAICARSDNGFSSYGLYSIDGAFRGTAVEPEPTDKPLLLLLHGAFSTVEGSFVGLGKGDRWRQCVETYSPGRTLGFQHETLSKSPLQNALDLVDRLPDGAKIDILSYSRGGLIAELLCTDPRKTSELFDALKQGIEDARDEALRHELDETREQLEALMMRIDKRGLRFERMVRVASPAAGSMLQDGRLDRTLNVVVNLLKLLFDAMPPWLWAVKSLLLAVVRQRLSARAFPGLAAMRSASPTIQVLANAKRVVSSRRALVTGNTEPGSAVLRHLRVFAMNRVLDGDNDLIVRTSSMLGGLGEAGAEPKAHDSNASSSRRAAAGDQNPVHVLADQGERVDHFRYFENGKTRDAVLAWLLEEAGSESAFHPLRGASMRDLAVDRGVALGLGIAQVPPGSTTVPDRPVLFIVPGIMGSHLQIGEDRIWVDVTDLAFGRFARLAFGARDITSEGLIARYYQRLAEAMSAVFEVELFHYDWRLSILESARLLAARVKARLREGRETHIIAHSMGGLVSRGLQVAARDVWSAMREKGGRLLMLGTPNHGSHEIVRLLFGRVELARYLGVVTGGVRSVLEVVREFPGVLELLPAPRDDDEVSHLLWDSSFWSDAKAAGAPSQEKLDAAKRTVEELREKASDPDGLLYVAGRAQRTPCGVVVDEERVRFRWTNRGDSTVTHTSGHIVGVPRWFVDIDHGELANFDDGFGAYAELLQGGETQLLPRHVPVSAREVVSKEIITHDGGFSKDEPLEDQPEPVQPSSAEIIERIFGGSAEASGRVQPRLVNIGVTHGDLKDAQHAVVLGHYRQTPLDGTESSLDRRVDDQLTRLMELGVYPEEIGKSVVVGSRPEASGIVVGLGVAGNLTVSRLRKTLEAALLEYLVRLGPNERVGISPVLLGTAGRQPLRIRDAVVSIVESVLVANRDISAAWSSAGAAPYIDRVEFIELFEGRAVEAARAVRDVERELLVPEGLSLTPARELKSLDSGRRASTWLREHEQWWRRIAVVHEDLGEGRFGFAFRAEARRGRTELDRVPIEPELLRGFVRIVERKSTFSKTTKEAGRTLFELLLSENLKDSLLGGEPVVLSMDRESARYPWEFIQADEASQPPVTRFGFIRQLDVHARRQTPKDQYGATALVVGNAHQGIRGHLRGAQEEAKDVAERLALGGVDVERMVGWTPKQRFVTSYTNGGWQIVHVATHGHVVRSGPHRGETSILFPKPGAKANGDILENSDSVTGALFGQTSKVPRLVFLNCCHIGNVDTPLADPATFAGSIATKLIEIGVQALIVAGWAVNDGAAHTFAQVFYDDMLAGRAFGDAVRHAREQTYAAHPTKNTWGAYQAYGDPTFRLHLPELPSIQTPLSLPETLDAIGHLTHLAKTCRLAKKDEVARQLRALEREIPERFSSNGEVLGSLGMAWRQLAEWDTADALLTRAFEQNDSTIRVEFIEQLANVRHRMAIKILRSRDEHHLSEVERERISWARRSTLELLDGLRALRQTAGPMPKAAEEKAPPPKGEEPASSEQGHESAKSDSSSEVESLTAAWAKREARLTALSGGDPTPQLRAALAGYDEAKKKENRGKRLAPYPTSNWALLQTLLTPEAEPVPDGIVETVNQCEAAAEALNKEKADIWHRLGGPDCDLIRLLLGSGEGSSSAVAGRYLAILKAEATAREIDTILDHLGFVIDIAASLRQDRRTTEARAVYDIIVDELQL